jgi:hypothetical protein
MYMYSSLGKTIRRVYILHLYQGMHQKQIMHQTGGLLM